jgi:hypothetical protein
MLVAVRALDRFALARAAGFRVFETLRISSPGMTKGRGARSRAKADSDTPSPAPAGISGL